MSKPPYIGQFILSVTVNCARAKNLRDFFAQIFYLCAVDSDPWSCVRRNIGAQLAAYIFFPASDWSIQVT